MRAEKTAIEFIGKHLDRSNLKLPIIKINSVCAFTGKPISEGIANKKLIKKSFTEHQYIRFPSVYSSVEAALCIEAVIPSEKGFNCLRNYSYLVTESELKLISRQQALGLILNPPPPPFVLCVTYSNKKHTAYKAVLNHNIESFTVTTDAGEVSINFSESIDILPVLQGWYTILQGKEKSEEKPTYFTKKEILKGSQNSNRIKRYGVAKYYEENSKIEKYRDTGFLNLIVHLLTKNENKNKN